MRFAAIGLDHRHIYDLVEHVLAAGAECAGYCPATSDPRVLAGFQQRFPDLKPVDRRALLDDPSIEAILCAAIPKDRAAIAVDAMRRGKDVLVDKPGVTSFAELAEVERAVAETGRIFSVCFSERFLTPSSILAEKLIGDGRIGRVVQTIGLGPHRYNGPIRPAWFFDVANYGGILTDIASHQIDQFLHFTGSEDGRIVSSSVGRFGHPDAPAFEDFGDILLESDRATGYIRVDWFTADGLPTWGDGRLVVLGTEGTLELRKYVDIDGRPGTDHVFLVDKSGTRHIDGRGEELTYFRNFVRDVEERTETAMSQRHVFNVCRLSLEAQANARRVPAGSEPAHALS